MLAALQAANVPELLASAEGVHQWEVRGPHVAAATLKEGTAEVPDRLLDHVCDLARRLEACPEGLLMPDGRVDEPG
jgi:hypothetical protein